MVRCGRFRGGTLPFGDVIGAARGTSSQLTPRAGIEMLAIPYPNRKLDPRRTALSMLDYCGCRPDDLRAVEETLAKDSQAGSAVAQDAVRQRTAGVDLFNPAELERHLQDHAYIRTADFEVPNTLKL